MENNVIIFQPSTLLEQDALACISVIKEGNAVNLKSAGQELPLAAVAIYRDNGQIIAVGAIKRPRPSYASSISERSCFPFNSNSHELGYVAVKKTHQKQGLSYKITDALLSTHKSYPIFATTSHEGMKRTLKKAGFIQEGTEWKGKRGDMLSLWIKTCK
jgi:RimJ/RimL family protein N-acetyltransferase